MSFGQAVSHVFSNYANFSGRARRSEYWYWVLFTILLSAAASLIDNLAGLNLNEAYPVGWVGAVIALVLLIPSIAVTFRRLHDTGRSGFWWLLNVFCLIGSIIMFVMCLQGSEPGANKYGPNPAGA